jgi:hypothetical protein
VLLTTASGARIKTALRGVIASPAAKEGTDGSIDVQSQTSPSTLSAGAFLPEISTPQLSVFTSSAWGSTSKKYVGAPSSSVFAATTTVDARDVEVESWGNVVVMFIRLTAEGKALYFSWNREISGGRIVIGIVTGLAPGTYLANGTFYPIHTYSLIDLAPSYVNTSTNNDYFTFGAEGFEIFLKWQGEEIARFVDYRHCVPGTVAIQHNTGYGFRDIAVRYLTPKRLFSRPDVKVMDLRDFGARDISAVGSINEGEDVVTFATPHFFRVGDEIIIETGGEAPWELAGSGRRFLTQIQPRCSPIPGRLPEPTLGWKIPEGCGLSRQAVGPPGTKLRIIGIMLFRTRSVRPSQRWRRIDCQ